MMISEVDQLTVQKGLCGNKEGSSNHSKQGDELQEPKPMYSWEEKVCVNISM